MDLKQELGTERPYAHWVMIASGLLASLTFTLIFAAIAEDVANREPLVIYDRLFEGWLVGGVTPAVESIFKAITLGGNSWVIATLALVLLGWLAWKKEWRLAVILMTSLAGGGLLDYGLKLIFHRPRPVMAGALTQATGYSFPSGHAMISIIFFGFLAYVLVKFTSGKARKTALILGIGLVLLAIGVSRLVLGVHYPTDVLAGWAAGAAWLTACLCSDRIIDRNTTV